MPSMRLVLVCLCTTMVAAGRSYGGGAFVLAGERIAFDASLMPHFTENQTRNSAAATRAGLAKWAATEHGQKLIAYFNHQECEITVIEDANENSAGRAPQPGIATLVAANDHSRLKTYELILNPTFFSLPKGMAPLPNQPATPADMMAAAWAGEMLHIYFYAQGISLPHHQRAEFQEEWRVMAEELGMAAMTHDDDDEYERRPRRRVAIRFIGQ